MYIRRVLALCVALAFLATGAVFAQRNNQPQQQKRSKTEQADIDTLVKVVDDVVAGQPAPTDVPLHWDMHHFIRQADGTTVFPFVVSVDTKALPSPDASVYLRVVDKAQPAPAAAAPAQENRRGGNQQPAARPQYPWENIYFLTLADGKFQRAVAVKPGEYDVYVAVKDRLKDEKSKAAPKIGVLKQTLTVPDLNTGLTTSDVIVAQAIEPLSSPLSQKESIEQPYVFGPLRIVPTTDGKFAKTSELNVVFWVYGAQNASTGKPDVNIDYNFNQKTADGEKFFNRTQPMALNATTLPPEFNAAAGHQLTGIQSIPLASFPPGDYRLEIKVTDKTNNQSVTRNVNFTVTAS